ncbi:hypothetical protein GCM10025777_06530 [Membranihabitans marinus]
MEEEESTQNWYKGNLHAHSLWSDGDDFPEMIMDWYKRNDYEFAVLSDHNILAEVDKWITIGDNKGRQQAYEKYKMAFDSTWIQTRRDSLDRIEVKLKMLSEYRGLYEEADSFLIIKAEEITDYHDGKHIHVNATNIQELIPAQGGDNVSDILQNNIDAVNEQRERLGVPMIPHINHPNFYWSINAEDIKKLDGERFFEVYNGHPAVFNFGDETHPGMGEMWDDIQTAYLTNDKPMMYGLATDDSHRYHNMEVGLSNPGRGWVRVGADNLTANAIVEALERGDFYSSSGVELKSISNSNGKLAFTIDPEEGVEYKIQFIGTKKSDLGQPGVVFEEVSGTEASYHLKQDDLYVRAVIISNKIKENPFQEGETEMAWIQPITHP